MQAKNIPQLLALAARRLAYADKEVVYSGPVYQSATISGNKVSISFSYIGGGLIAKDGKDLHYFAIAGAGKKFVWANAKIDGDKIVIWNDSILNPYLYATPGPITPKELIYKIKKGCLPRLSKRGNNTYKLI